MYKEDLALNNLHWLICLKAKPSLMKKMNLFFLPPAMSK